MTVKGWDDDPHTPLPPEVAAAEQAKMAEALKAAGVTGAGSPGGIDPGDPLPTGFAMHGRQMDQSKGYWCGPAAVQEALMHEHWDHGFSGVSMPTQATLASNLATNIEGTGWSGGSGPSGRPIPDTLNYYLRNYSPRYYAHDVWSATSDELAKFKSAVTYDISKDNPVIGDAWQEPYGKHLVGHPIERRIKHYYTMYAYSSSGAYVRYEDSAHSPAVSFGSSVPEYSTKTASDLNVINSGFGYIW